jgi:hypothetical protein
MCTKFENENNTSKQEHMIRKQQEKDIDEIINIWYKASGLAHSFLKTDFVEQVKKDLRDVYLPNAATWLYEDNHSVVGFISMLGNEIGGDYLYCRITTSKELEQALWILSKNFILNQRWKFSKKTLLEELFMKNMVSYR